MAKILMVEDDADLLSVFQAALIKEGFEVITAGDGKLGLEKAKTEKPNLILLDQILPGATGNEILSLLKADPDTKQIPVAMVSNFGQTDLVQQAIDKGAVDYILKYQIEVADLVTKVKGMLAETTNPTPA